MYRPNLKLYPDEDDSDPWQPSESSSSGNDLSQKKSNPIKVKKARRYTTSSLTIENQTFAHQAGLNIDFVDVHFADPQRFFVLRDDYVAIQEAEKSQNELNEFYRKQRQHTFLSNVNLNDAAVISVDGKSFLRCLVTKIFDQSNVEVEVLCVDDHKGKSVKVASSSLISLRALYSKPAPLPIVCQLSDVEVSTDRVVLKKIKELFDTFVNSEYEISIFVTDTIKSSPFVVHLVHLFFFKDNQTINFNAIIAGLRLAVITKPSLMDNIVTISSKNAHQVFEIASLEVTNPADIRFVRKDKVESSKLFHRLVQISPFQKRSHIPFAVGDPCLVKIKDKHCVDIFRGIIQSEQASSIYIVNLIDKGIEVTKSSAEIFDYVDVSLMKEKSKLLKVGFKDYHELTDHSKKKCHKKLVKFMKTANQNYIEAEISIDADPLLLKLTTYKKDMEGKKIVLDSFAVHNPDSESNRKLKNDLKSKNFTVLLNSTIETPLTSYLTVKAETGIVVDMIPELEATKCWLPYSPPQTDRFDANCNCIDESGNMFLSAQTDQNILESLKAELKSFYSKFPFASSDDYVDFMMGDPVIVHVKAKKEYCRGVITDLDISNGLFKVFLIDSGSYVDQVSHSELTNMIVASKLPSLVGKFRLINMINKKWTKLELRKLSDFVVNRKVTATVLRKRGDIYECSISCVSQSNGLIIDDLNSHFQVEDQPEKTIKKFEIRPKSEVSDLMTISELEKLQNASPDDETNAIFVAVAVPEQSIDESSYDDISYVMESTRKKRERKDVCILNSKKKIENFELASSKCSIDEFNFSSAKYFNDRLYLKADIKQLNELIKRMKIMLRDEFRSFKLSTHSKNQYCLVKRDGEFFRGKILELDEFGDSVTVLLVDVPETVEEQFCNLYQMSSELFSIPCENIPVKLKSSGPSSEEDEKQMEMLVQRLNATDKFTKGDKMFKAKVFQFIPCGDSIVEIFDPDTDEKLA